MTGFCKHATYLWFLWKAGNFLISGVTVNFGRAMADAVSRRVSPRTLGFAPVQSLWDLWWTKWR
jgi:hypothetical protein